MAVRFQLPFADVGDGINPSDGALLYFYVTGTTTLKATYSNEALSVANANPVVADSDGVFSDIWVEGNSRYKVVLKDKNSVQMWESDPVVANLSAADVSIVFSTKADMTASTDLVIGDTVEILGYTAKGDGGDNRYEIVAAATGTDDGGTFIDLSGSGLQAKGLFPGGTMYSKQFGATGDGVTNDTTAVIAADAAAVLDSKIIVFTTGVYVVDSLTLGATPRFEGGGRLSVNSTETVTINKPIEAGRHHIFDGAGSILLNDEASHIALPEWFNAFPDLPLVDASLALQKLSDSVVASRECLVLFAPGTWYLQTKVTWSRACRVVGSGIRLTHFRCATGFSTGDVFDTADEGVSFENIQFSSATPRTSGRYIAMLHNFCIANGIWFTDGFQGVDTAGNACKTRDITGFVWSSAVGSYIVNLAGGSNSASVKDTVYIDSGAAKPEYVVKVGDTTDFAIEGVNAKGFGIAAVGVVVSSGTCSQGQIDNVMGQGNGPAALLIESTGTGAVESLQIGKVQADGLTAAGVELKKGGSGIMKYIHMEQVESRACVDGLKVSASSGSVDHWSVSGGFLRGCSGNGLDIAASDYWRVSGLQTVSNTGVGTIIASGCANFIYTNNHNLFNGTAFTDNSGAVTKVIANNI